jgi:hypothetical protein
MFVHASLYALVATAAWTYGRTVPSHRIIALLFAWELAADMARLAIGPMLDAAAPPYAGSTLFLYYLDQALVLSFRFALVAACLRHFNRSSIWPAAYAFAATTLAVIVFKETTRASLLPVHTLVAVATAGVCWVLAIRAVLAPPSRLQTPDGAHAVLLVILALVLVKACMYYFGPVGETWSEILMSDTFVHGIIAVGYLGALLRNGVRHWHTS